MERSGSILVLMAAARTTTTTERRTHAERTEATTAALLDAGRELFAQDGYAATSLEAVVARAGVTKGALYHHFASKRELFAAVYEREQHRLARHMAAAYDAGGKDPWKAFEAGCRAFLEAILDPGVQRIVLLDSASALGWEGMRAGEVTSERMLHEGIRRAIDAGAIPKRRVEPLAALLLGAICEAAMTIARAEDQPATMRAMVAELRTLLKSLATPPG